MSEEKNVKVKATLSPATVFLYGLGGMFPYGWILVITGYYFLFFMTDILKLPTVLAASIYSAIQWWKLAAMVISGIVIDGTSLRSGKYRGWVLITGIVMAVAFPIAFADFGLSQTGAAVVVVAAEVVLMLAYNIGWTGVRTLPNAMSKNGQDVTWLSTASAVGGSLPTALWGVLAAPMLSFPLWAGSGNAYAGCCAVFSVTLLLGGFIIYKIAAPYDKPQEAGSMVKAEKIGLLDMIKNLNGPMIPFFIAQTLSTAQAGFFSTLLAYYTTHVLGNTAIAAQVLSITSIISLVGSFFVPSITKYLSKKGAHIISQFTYCVCYVLMGLFGRSAGMFIALRCVMAAVGCVSNVVMYAFPVDIADYNEMHGKDPARAFLMSIGGTTIRLGYALSTTIAAFGLAAIGYVTGVEVTAAMGTKIILLMVAGPAALALLSAVSMFAYKVDEKELEKYRAERALKN